MGLAKYFRLLAVLVILLSGCSDGHLKQTPPGVPPPPTAADPWFGTAGNVLISDRNFNKDGILDYLWIGFNSTTAWQNFQNEVQQFPQGGFMIGGVVVPSSRTAVNFYFDPNTTITAEISIPEISTLLDGLKVDPTVTPQFSKTWMIPVTIEQVK